MRIKSDFKDYYDFQATIYGVDKSITYNRKRIVDLDIRDSRFGRDIIEENLKIDTVNGWGYIPDPYGWGYKLDDRFEFHLLVVGDKVFLVSYEFDIYKGYSYRLVDENHPSYIKFNTIRNLVDNPHYLFGPDVTTKLCREVEHPVFIVSSTGGNRNQDVIVVQARCPVLKDIQGLAAKYPPEQIYQDLSYFLTNKMKNSPDESPISVLTDKEKIIQHGMDVKQSFRHRK